MHKPYLLALLVFFAGTATASSGRTMKVDIDGQFAQQHHDILTALDDGKTYSEISIADLQTVRTTLARIATAINAAGGVDNLNATQKSEIFNDQAQVNSILTKAGEDSRLVCKREIQTGSHRSTKQCTTIAQRRRSSEQSSDVLRRSMLNNPTNRGE